MTGMSNISKGNSMPMNCGMQGMHGNEKIKAKTAVDFESKVGAAEIQKQLPINESIGNKYDVSI